MLNSTNNEKSKYGHLDTSYKAAGEENGLRKLCEDFYMLMGSLPEAQNIRQMHNDDITIMTDKLTMFLCMWLGGPKTYRERYGLAGMPQAHNHLPIGTKEKDAWLMCMDQAIDKQSYHEDFKKYLKRQLRFPAELIRKSSNLL